MWCIFDTFWNYPLGSEDTENIRTKHPFQAPYLWSLWSFCWFLLHLCYLCLVCVRACYHPTASCAALIFHIQVQVAGGTIKNTCHLPSPQPYPIGYVFSEWRLNEVNHMKYHPPFFCDSNSWTNPIHTRNSCRGANDRGTWILEINSYQSPSSRDWNFRMHDCMRKCWCNRLLLFLLLFLPPSTQPQDLPLTGPKLTKQLHRSMPQHLYWWSVNLSWISWITRSFIVVFYLSMYLKVPLFKAKVRVSP